MSISKQEYILRSLSTIAHKKWEVFIISRIIHGLDDDIEFVTQQLVRISDEKRALTDLYFPQFNLHLEIDEPPHENQLEIDRKREQDIIKRTEHQVVHIKIAVNDLHEKRNPIVEKDISLIRRDVDKFIEKIRQLKNDAVTKNTFTKWDFENRYSPEPVINRGKVAIQDNVVFRTQVEALRCFGFKGQGWQRGVWKIPGTDDVVWFPRLYPHGMWHNELVECGTIINEKAVNKDGIQSIKQQIEDSKAHPNRKWIVFAKARDALGFNLLRYVGGFKVNLEKSKQDMLVLHRVSTEEPVRK